jgi:hypothetical protein
MLDYDGKSARLTLFNDQLTRLEDLLSVSRPKKMLLGGGAGAAKRGRK